MYNTVTCQIVIQNIFQVILGLKSVFIYKKMIFSGPRNIMTGHCSETLTQNDFLRE